MPGRPCAQLVERVAGDGPGVMVAGHDRDRGHGGEATDLEVGPPLLHDVGATVGVVADIPPVELDALLEADTGQAGMRRFQHRYPRPSPTRSAHAVARRSSLGRDHQRGAPTGNPWGAQAPFGASTGPVRMAIVALENRTCFAGTVTARPASPRRTMLVVAREPGPRMRIRRGRQGQEPGGVGRRC